MVRYTLKKKKQPVNHIYKNNIIFNIKFKMWEMNKLLIGESGELGREEKYDLIFFIFFFFLQHSLIEKDMIGILLTRLWGMNIKIKSFFFWKIQIPTKKKKTDLLKEISNKSIFFFTVNVGIFLIFFNRVKSIPFFFFLSSRSLLEINAVYKELCNSH